MVIAFFQFVSTAVVWIVLKIFTRFEVNGRENLREIRRPFIIVANHESHLDPPLVGVAMLYQPKLFPIRFMAKDQLFWIPGFNLLIWLLGSFRARKKQGIGRTLLGPVKILENKGGLVMFPEAHIFPERGALGSGRRGAAILALTTRAQLVPISLHTPAGLNPFKFIFTRPHIVINIGEPFYLNNTYYLDFSDENTTAATAVIMGKIAALYHQHQY
ncbi:MAG TPA: lysophospholipid acyltransferase family protein [Candidatus Saccharimonadales bacterium]|nr:lysophospholipid acyltransferase family protein [Candidatus Saccharimonadales bacterium]